MYQRLSFILLETSYRLKASLYTKAFTFGVVGITRNMLSIQELRVELAMFFLSVHLTPLMNKE